MKIKVNQKFKLADIIKHDSNKSLWEQTEEAGAKMMLIPGRIGGGGKTHNFTIQYIDTPEGIGICSMWCLCGSAKWKSHLQPIFDDEFIVNCKRCMK